MKRVVVLGITLILVGVWAGTALSCTCFAVYSDHPLYGMNFDYPPNEIRFSIEEHETGAVFIGSFWMGDHYGRTVGMNEQGLFASDQMVSPLRNAVDEEGDGEIYVWRAFYEGLQTCSTVSEAIAMVGERRLVSYPELALHNFYADPSGNAVIMEAGDTANVLTRIDGPFMVMTNFQNGDFQDAAPSNIYGDGAGRYRTANAAISSYLDSSDTFDVEQAFDVLNRAATPVGNYKTRYSLVLDPESLEIYIAIERDYDHIWKVSLVDRTIETYDGFAQHTVLPLGDDGITGPTLQAYVKAPMPDSTAAGESASSSAELWGIVSLALILGLAVVCLLR